MTAPADSVSRPSPLTGLLLTDLDGTLLDHDTYQPSRESLEIVVALRRVGVVTVPVTSKTAAEVRHLAGSVAFGPVAVVEGGAVAIVDDDLRILGPGRAQLRSFLVEIREDLGLDLRGFGDMTDLEVAARCDLDLTAARRAMDRQASEPFVIETGGTEVASRVQRLATDRGFTITRGGRFWHLVGAGVDKGASVDWLRRHLRGEDRPVAAVGDAWNDLPMLAAADAGVLLGSTVDDDDIPTGVERVAVGGPRGFERAVSRISSQLGWPVDIGHDQGRMRRDRRR